MSYTNTVWKVCAIDLYCGLLSYDKSELHYEQRDDLECIWVEIYTKNKHILFGLFYPPPSSDITISDDIEESIRVAIETGIREIIVTCDFNYNSTNSKSAQNVQNISRLLALEKVIDEPTYFTESSVVY